MKNLFVFNIQSTSDVITNSSSELFVFNDKGSKAQAIELLDSIYPNWRSEYEEPKELKDASDRELDIYFYNVTGINSYFDSDCSKAIKKFFGRFENDARYLSCSEIETIRANWSKEKDSQAIPICKELGLTPEEAFSNWAIYDPFDTTAYYMQNIAITNLELTATFKDAYKKKHGDTVLLFSLYENPDWEMQEEIEKYAIRFHLG